MAIFGALLGALGFGTANVVIKKSLSTLSIPQTLMMSTLSGAVCLLIIMILRGIGIGSGNEILIASGLALLEIGLYLALYRAYDEGNVTVATAVINTYPMFSTFLTIIFLNEQVAPYKFIFIGLMAVGAVIVSIDWNKVFKDGFDKSDLVKGLPWIIISMIIHALYFPLLGNFTADGSWESKLFIIKIVSTVVLFILFFVIQKKSVLPPKSLVPFTSLLGILEVVGWSGLALASNSSEGQLAIIITMLNSAPLVTAILAFIFLKEQLSKIQYFGILVIVISLIGLSL